MVRDCSQHWYNPFVVENIQISDQVWQVIENYAQMKGATFELSERLRRMKCEFCETANPVGEPRCIACGAPLGDVQPDTCPNCGYVIESGEKICPNCNHVLSE
jgi:DNA-directed RNA polymerase subunit RPC12/RpoP